MRFFIYAILIIFMVLSLFPTFLMFFTAFVPEGDLFNRTIEKTITDFELPKAILLSKVRPVKTTINLIKEGENSFLRIDASKDFSGIAPSMGSSDINKVKFVELRLRNEESIRLRVGFKDIKDRVDYCIVRDIPASREWQNLRFEIKPGDLSLDTFHISQLRIETLGDGWVDIDDVKLVNRYPTFYNFVKVLRDDYFGRYLLNSAIVSTGSVVGNLFFCSMVAYAFARKNFRFKELLFSLILGTMMIPPQVTIIPTFILMKKLGFIDTYWALILPNLVTPFGIFLMRQYIEQLPVELDQAAFVDGATDFQIFRYIILPLSKPALSVLGINTFVLTWNDVFYPLILTTSREMRTVQIGLALYQKLNVFTWPSLMAASAIAGLPIILMFLIFEKRIISGILEGAIKS
ncbi:MULTISPECIES: carbohydrate ABC transporter permease [Pseudothermotoga]|uniref:Binding-protein-dependent transport systems inner membrane component n=1 Tax=Pseudothermotoga lettingae (strain ATCC BAA-301 / DSM 14385 / NBRC 107922 / TMO) TaxID=416591 RepID=A8F371_PSELT|nr:MULTISPECIES: carbohydrate ABC transporter permease [Pseudothermotoga]ABV32605.1 binding-protein-dependent transport systems inner membrane component [Pseudothermotoga lettingae TMO]GLI48407.1 hypothetical protein PLETTINGATMO_05760 [Pseudothermotoga lettingae TMO]HBJ82018.1 carbohydrate ABC transporter permease [Pseudothermotoga sp.]HBT25362.1 carbohydrate ABC transporter permease [Pseudothermotoga sp.]